MSVTKGKRQGRKTPEEVMRNCSIDLRVNRKFRVEFTVEEGRRKGLRNSIFFRPTTSQTVMINSEYDFVVT